MAGTTQVRAWWGEEYRCNPRKYVLVDFPGDGRVWSLPVADKSEDIWTELAKVMFIHDYLFRESAGGTYNCRPPSLHAYGLALDLNPSKNPYGISGKTDMPTAFIEDVEAIKTTKGSQAILWGGRWPKSNPPDPMHFQINVPPNDTTVIPEDPLMVLYRKIANVPDKAWAKEVVDDGITVGAINTADKHEDDWEAPITYGTLWTILDRLGWPKGTK